jgi:alkanesulfonate monooxygenase SsuD/methylene tetrahydromethanopterin reductase-like flavin-dependent oxidoreductase (luciferase family)
VRHALFLAPFTELSDPAALVSVARAADAAAWDGLFLWDHVLRDPAETSDVADAWTMLAAIAAATERLRIGPMVTPVSRRRIATLVRQTVTLDHLSGGRLTMGLGLGVDGGGELSRFGEITDARTRGAILDEGADLLDRAWSGEQVDHDGEHLVVDGVTFLPRPVQRPRIPLWFAARGAARRPVRRAARYDGLFAIEMDPAGLADALAMVADERGSLDGFDVAVRSSPIEDPELLEVPGVTWAMHSFPPDVPAAEALAVAEAGPPST